MRVQSRFAWEGASRDPEYNADLATYATPRMSKDKKGRVRYGPAPIQARFHQKPQDESNDCTQSRLAQSAHPPLVSVN